MRNNPFQAAQMAKGAQKSNDPGFRQKILHVEYPAKAKRLGDSRIGYPRISKKSLIRKNPELLGSGWDGIKTTVMLDALRVKFHQNLALGARLLATNEAEIIKDSDTDYFWGTGADGTGQNELGKLLMQDREELKAKKHLLRKRI